MSDTIPMSIATLPEKTHGPFSTQSTYAVRRFTLGIRKTKGFQPGTPDHQVISELAYFPPEPPTERGEEYCDAWLKFANAVQDFMRFISKNFQTVSDRMVLQPGRNMEYNPHCTLDDTVLYRAAEQELCRLAIRVCVTYSEHRRRANEYGRRMTSQRAPVAGHQRLRRPEGP